MITELCLLAPKDWRIQSVENVCLQVTSGGTPSRRESAYFQRGFWPWVKTQELLDRWIDDTEEHITDEAIKCSSAKLLPANTILVAMYGATVGQLGILRQPMTCNQACCALTVDSTKVDYRYLFFLLLNARAQLKNLATGAAQQNLSGALIKSLQFPFPPLPEQRAIAHILGILDDKIELNRQMNETLEAMARAIFKSWFVNFDPVRAKAEGRDTGLPEEIAELFPDSFEETEMGEVPKGWRFGNLGEYALNFDSKRVPVSGSERAKRQGSYPYHGAAGIMDYVDSYLFDGVHLLVGEDGSVIKENGLAVTQYVWGKIWVNNHAHVLQGKGSVSTEQLYLYFDFQPVAPYVTGAVQPKLSQGRMNTLPFIFAGDDVCEAFAKQVNTWFVRLRYNSDEIKILSALRDTLLPKLISGELRVIDAEHIIGGISDVSA